VKSSFNHKREPPLLVAIYKKKCFLNMSNAEKFSSDRTIEEYARDIWHIEVKKI
jgi:hypothetical protein